MDTLSIRYTIFECHRGFLTHVLWTWSQEEVPFCNLIYSSHKDILKSGEALGLWVKIIKVVTLPFYSFYSFPHLIFLTTSCDKAGYFYCANFIIDGYDFWRSHYLHKHTQQRNVKVRPRTLSTGSMEPSLVHITITQRDY